MKVTEYTVEDLILEMRDVNNENYNPKLAKLIERRIKFEKKELDKVLKDAGEHVGKYYVLKDKYEQLQEDYARLYGMAIPFLKLLLGGEKRGDGKMNLTIDSVVNAANEAIRYANGLSKMEKEFINRK